MTKIGYNASNNRNEDYHKTWTKSTLSIVIAVAICYGIWFNLLDSLALCQQLDKNNQFSHTCTSIGTIFGGNQFYQPWNIIGHFLPGLFMALLFKEKKLELFVAGALISTVVMDSPLWGVERKFFHGLPLWDGLDELNGNHTHITSWRVGDWIMYYYNPVGFYSVWDHDWLFPHFPNAATIFWSIVGRIAAAVLLISYQHKKESNNEYFSLKKLLVRKIGSAHELTKDGTWFRDSEGRYVLFRGINFASRSKLPPYLPIAPLDKKTIDLNELKKELNKAKSQFEYLKDLGCNIVRLLLMWKAIEPKPNPNLNQLLPEGEQYLQFIKEILDAIYVYDLFVILDFHQDIAHGVYGGDGFPDWALAIDESHPHPPQSNFKDRSWGMAYYLNYLVRHTLGSFWRNRLRNIEAGLQDYPVRTHFEKTIGQTVRFFKNLNNGEGHPAVLGVQPFNEPHQVSMDKQAFEEGYLKEFYSNVLTEINKFDSRIFVFIEPRVDWNLYSVVNIFEPRMDWSKYNPFQSNLESQLGFIDKQSQIHTWLPTDSNFLDQFKLQGVFSFHYYDPWTLFYSFFNYPDNMYNKQREWPNIFKQMHHAAISRGLVPFLTEFGGSHDWEGFHTDFPPYAIYHGKQIRAYMNLHFIQVESLLANAIYWNYDLYNTAEGKDNWNLENFSLLGPDRKPRHTDIVARPYPMRSSAKPYLLFFDLETKHCAIILKGPVVSEPTIVYVPYAMHYSSGFKVWASSKDATWDKNNQRLYWYPDSNQLSNQIIITSSQGLNISVLPDESKKLLDKTTITFEFNS